MDWIRTNRFLAGLASVVIAGVLGLGFYAFTGWRGAVAATGAYDQTAGNIDRLERRAIFPKQENLDEKIALVAALGKAADSLQSRVTKGQRELKHTLGEQEFRKLVGGESEAVAAIAAAADMTIPAEFHFGLDAYQSGKVINPRAIPLLEWEMDAIKQFVSLAAASGIDTIEEFARREFPQEDKAWKSPKEIAEEKKAAGAQTRPAPRPGRAKPENAAPVASNPLATADKVMETYRFSAEVKGSHDAVQTLLNRLATDPTYFLWTRQLRIENEKKLSPRQSDVPGPVQVPDIEPDENGATPMIDATLLFGAEKIYARLVIDVVRFKDTPRAEKPAPAAPDTTPPAPGSPG